MRNRLRRGLDAAGGIVFIAGGLAVIHFSLPGHIQQHLAFDHAEIKPWALWTSAFVHRSSQHLFDNLVWFGILAVVAYLHCDQQDRSVWFWQGSIALLVLLPPLANLSGYAIYQSMGIELTTRGFSGVVAGFGGFVLVALTTWMVRKYGSRVGYGIGVTIFLFLMAEIFHIYGGAQPLESTIVLVVGLSVAIGYVVRELTRRPIVKRKRLARDVGISAGVGVLLLGLIAGLFPAEIVQGGSLTNIVGHYAGLVWGGVLAIVLYFLLQGEVDLRGLRPVAES